MKINIMYMEMIKLILNSKIKLFLTNKKEQKKRQKYKQKIKKLIDF